MKSIGTFVSKYLNSISGKTEKLYLSFSILVDVVNTYYLVVLFT